MKIAVVAPIEETVPPTRYGGTEWIVYEVAHGIGKKGHNVDLYASADSKKDPSYNLIPVTSKSIRTDPHLGSEAKIRETAKILYFGKLIDQLHHQQYDLIHNHIGWRFLALAPVLDIQIITTHHGPLYLGYQQLVFREYKDYPYVSISNNQRKDLPDINYVSTVYNGIDMQRFPFYDEATDEDNYLLFFARFSHEKGGLEAIQAAKKMNKPLKIGAKIDLVDQGYFDQAKPFIDNKLITFMGEVGQAEKDKEYQHARALLVPICWEEPFGLMFTESMACGTPVITFARGSAPEIIQDGKTGFLINQSEEFIRGDWVIKKTGVEGLCEAIERIYAMPKDEYIQMRKNSRASVEEKFSAEKMVDGYEKAYEKVLRQGNSKKSLFSRFF